MDNIYLCQMIKRNQTENIRRLLKQFPAVAILGARQTGKTTIAKQIQNDWKIHTIYLDLELDSHIRRIEHDPELYLSNYKDSLVIIDEIQRKPELFALLRALIDENRKPGRFLLLGSSSPQLVKGVSESLAGRIAYIEIGGISIQEAASKKIGQNTLWLRGGFPLPLLAKDSNTADIWYKNFIRSFVEQDISRLFGIDASSAILRNLLRMLSGYNGGLFNKEEYARSLGITAPTVKRYLQLLNGAFLINELPPWSPNIKKRIVKNSKIYIRDTGILHSLNDITEFDELYGDLVAGLSWEGFVIEQIRLAQNQFDMYFYRTHNGAESDLVLIKKGKAVACIEIKLTTAPRISRGFYQVIDDLKTKKNFIIIPQGDSYPANTTIQCVNLKDFIIKILPEL
jgi:uncharacterized protein